MMMMNAFESCKNTLGYSVIQCDDQMMNKRYPQLFLKLLKKVSTSDNLFIKTAQKVAQ